MNFFPCLLCNFLSNHYYYIDSKKEVLTFLHVNTQKLVCLKLLLIVSCQTWSHSSNSWPLMKVSTCKKLSAGAFDHYSPLLLKIVCCFPLAIKAYKVGRKQWGMLGQIIKIMMGLKGPLKSRVKCAFKEVMFCKEWIKGPGLLSPYIFH